MKRSLYALILCAISLFLSSFKALDGIYSVFEQPYSLVPIQDLSSQTVYSLATDHQGFVWMATRNGIDRYDGIAIRHYHLGDSPMRTMRSGLTTTIYCDDNGRLWAYTERSIIYMYDPQLDKFVEVFNMPDYQMFGSSQALYCKGNTLVVGSTEGITLFDIETKTVTHRLCPDENIHIFAPYDDNRIFFGCNRGIGILEIEEQRFTIHDDWVHSEAKALYYCTKENRLWVGSNGNGMFIVDPKNPAEAIHIANSGGMIISDIKPVTGDKEMLIGVDGAGVFVCPVDADKNSQLRLFASDANMAPYALRNSGIRGLLVDHGYIWIAAFRGGVTMLKPGSNLTTLNAAKVETPSDNYAFGVDVSEAGRYWVAFTRTISSFAPDGSDVKTALDVDDATFLSVRAADDGTIWAGGYNTGTYHIDPTTGKKEFFPSVVDQPVLDCVYDIFEDKRGDIWIGGLNFQLTRMHQNPDKTYEKTHYPVTLVNSISQLNEELIVAATTDGFSTVNVNTGEIKKYFDDEYRFEGTNYISDVRTRLGHEVWLATAGAGLVCYDVETDSIDVFGLDDGLPSLELRGMSMMHDSILYISTENSGLFVFDCGLRRYERCLKTNDDLPIDEFYQNSCTMTPDGGLLFGGDNGVVTLTTTDMHTDLRQFDIVIEATGLQGDVYYADPDSRTVDLFLTTTDIYHQKEYVFYFRMPGIEDQWTLIDKSRRIHFSHMPPGTYELEIHAVGAANQVSARTITVKVEATNWSHIILYIALALFLASGFMMWKVYKKKK